MSNLIIIIMKLSLLEKDQLSKESLATVKGGACSPKVCGCICVGPVTPEQVVISDESCADCGVSNAHRVLN